MELVIKMKVRKNFGICMIILGFVLMMDQTPQFSEVTKEVTLFFQQYWPLLVVFLGMVLWLEPSKK